jgi:hypothetical protein
MCGMPTRLLVLEKICKKLFFTFKKEKSLKKEPSSHFHIFDKHLFISSFQGTLFPVSLEICTIVPLPVSTTSLCSF